MLRLIRLVYLLVAYLIVAIILLVFNILYKILR